MCRREARAASDKADVFRAAGAARVVALVKEDLGKEVAEFKADFWKEEVMKDTDLAFYHALGGGQAHKPFKSGCAFIAAMLNPFNKTRTKQNVKASKGVPQNMIGEGLVAGGTYVLRADGVPAYSFAEQELGDSAPLEDVVAAVKSAAAEAGADGRI
mmetsp:Transcript_43439/g.131341  ORF Transcript_43439/g.131341 Transcript_43439/m.131341 type:complete len:157 (-) Transcript_43439:7-477(-)